MKTSNNTPDTILLLIIKFSILFLLSSAILNAPGVTGHTIHHPIQKPILPPEVQKVQQIYTSQIGIKEKGINTGAAVEQYLRYVNLPKGNPWCAAFVCWVYAQAGVENPKTGWSPTLFPDNKVIWEKGRTRAQNQQSISLPNADPTSPRTENSQPLTPHTGDLFSIYFPDKKRIAHVGFIDQWDGTWLITVEGNTNVSGSSEGDGVYSKRRLVKSIYKVARYINY